MVPIQRSVLDVFENKNHAFGKLWAADLERWEFYVRKG